MRHMELIELLHRRREIIDQAFNGSNPEEVPEDLIDSGLFRKIGKKYELVDSYKQFANILLKRVDANYIFGDYIKEHKLLIEHKNNYKDTVDPEYLKRITSLIKTLYGKFYDRDALIESKVAHIVNDNDLSIDVIIRDAEDVQERILELVTANYDNSKVFRELKGLNEEIDELLIDFGIDIMGLTENIHTYISRLSDFILRTKKRKEQNNKLLSLSTKIIHENDMKLEAVLRSKKNEYINIPRRKTPLVKVLPSGKDIHRDKFLTSAYTILQYRDATPRGLSGTTFTKKEPVVIKNVDFAALLKDIEKNKPQDVYDFIFSHREIDKFSDYGNKEIQAFKAYLAVVTGNRVNIDFEQKFNKHNIRIAKWI